MKRVTLIAAIIAAGTTPVLADSANWSMQKQIQISINRCSNAGQGNGGETFDDDACMKRQAAGEQSIDMFVDFDPGNS